MKKLALAIALAMVLVMACGEECDQVEYNLTCEGVTCSDTDDESSYTTLLLCSIYECTWYCHDYNGNECAYVSLEFERCLLDLCWSLGNEFIDSGECD